MGSSLTKARVVYASEKQHFRYPFDKRASIVTPDVATHFASLLPLLVRVSTAFEKRVPPFFSPSMLFYFSPSTLRSFLQMHSAHP